VSVNVISARAARAEPRTAVRPRSFSEAAAWRSVCNGWRPLFGNFRQLGFSIEWHDFTCSADVDWARSFHPDSLELCLNLTGTGGLEFRARTVKLAPLNALFYFQGRESLHAWRPAQERHQFLTAEFSREFLKRHINGKEAGVHPLVKAFLAARPDGGGVAEVRELSIGLQNMIASLREPSVLHAAKPLWYQAKALELISDFFFTAASEQEFFCERHKRMTHERVARAMGILQSHLAEPPDLEELGRKVGCSPFYLSRMFSAETGMTIPQYLRKARMEHAAELLLRGKHNVTEAAMEVGYSSLSHFSQAFCQTMGCCPNLYPQLKRLGKVIEPASLRRSP
jgi:AraC-like DNA-binding protein